MIDLHRAILDLYPSVDYITGDIAYDENGNVVTYDQSAVLIKANLKALRVERNRKLSSTDWWASSDLTMTEAQTAYRQALRDITDTYTSLDDVVWPEEPV